MAWSNRGSVLYMLELYGTCWRTCRSSRVCWAASLRLGCTLDVSWPTRACSCGSSRGESSRSNTSSSNNIDCRRRKEWRHTSQSPSVRDQRSEVATLCMCLCCAACRDNGFPTIQQGPDEKQESWVLTNVLQPFNTDAHIIQSHQHQPAPKHQHSQLH